MLSYPTLRYHIIRTKTGDSQDITVKLIQQVLADLNKREEFEFVYDELANIIWYCSSVTTRTSEAHNNLC